MLIIPVMNRFGELLKRKREERGMSQAAAGTHVGITGAAFGKLERGETARPNNWRKIAQAFDIDEDVADNLIALDAAEVGKESKIGAPDAVDPAKIARIAKRSSVPRGKIPVYGGAAAGDPDRLIMLTEVVESVEPPHELMGVSDGYALFVHGTSMEPRYFPGERVYVHPHKPVKKGDFCVVQLGDDVDNPEAGFIKRFISKDDKHVKVSQLNPPKVLTFKAGEVVATHRIVASGSD